MTGVRSAEHMRSPHSGQRPVPWPQCSWISPAGNGPRNYWRRAKSAAGGSWSRLPLALAFVRYDGILPFVNNRFVRVLGYTAEDIPTLDVWWKKAYPDPDYRQRVRLQWGEAVRRSGEEHADIIPAEYRVTCKNGEERIFEVSGITLSDGFLAMFIDRTERRSSPLPE